MPSLPLWGVQDKFTWRLAALVLFGESLVIVFGALTARGLAAASGDGNADQQLWIGLGLAALALIAAGSMRRAYGIFLGWLVQALTIASGFVVGAMFIVGLIFLALWIGGLVAGRNAARATSVDTVSE